MIVMPTTHDAFASAATLEFLAAMVAAGIVPAEPIADRLGNQILRFCCVGDGQGRRNGWAVIYHDDERAAGAFGNYRMDLTVRWRSGHAVRLNASEREELASRHAQMRADRLAVQQRRHLEAAIVNRSHWNNAGPPKSWHPYLAHKGIVGEGLRQTDGWLLAPMHDANGVLWNIQRIDQYRKLFSRGAKTEGLFLQLGEPAGTICIAEGYATGAVVRRATDHAVVIAFSAKNLLATATSIRRRYPDVDIVLCADDDAHLIANPKIGRNVGAEAAKQAAQAVGGRVAMPPRKEMTL